ncbi:MAG: hypothetical protein Q8K59_06170 [Nitrosomonas sp.]|nr:hypothetical protein [Nitrosomonas sp.]MDP1950669.1 hypothetical protein [Nitrosomonas sp.]
MSEYLDQISVYFETVPLWPFLLFGVLGIAALAIEVVNRKRKADAIHNFRYTIETELAGMYPKSVNWPKNVDTYLRARLPEMQENFEVMRVFLPQDLLLAYNTAWNKYRDFCLAITDEKCAATESSLDNEPDPKEVFHRLVSDLLEFAQKV